MTPPRHEWLRLRPWQRHSLVLAFAGLIYVSYGAILAVTPHHDRDLLLPRGVWAAVWITVGVLSLASTRWPPRSKTWGYTALAALAAVWASIYALGVVFGGPLSGLNGTLAWALVAFLWWAISGLVNPDDVPKDR